MTSQALRRYYDILSGEADAKYLSAKTRSSDLDPRSPTADLWREHDAILSGALADVDGNRGTTLLEIKTRIAERILEECVLCERRCQVDRIAGETGHCGVSEPRVSSDFIHVGEEPDLVPSYTIFFSGCTFNCVFCQNWDISTKPGSGRPIAPERMSRMIEEYAAGARGRQIIPLGSLGPVRNVNWVGGDPTSNLAYILSVLSLCNANLPQVWNSNMYLTEESMRLLEGVIDVYLTDFKYGNDKCALRLSNAPDYMGTITRNHLIGRRQAEMIIRHLVLPGHVDCCTRPVLKWIADNLNDVRVNVMSQYRPEHRAREFPELSRRLSAREYEDAMAFAEELGLDLTY